MYPLHVLRILQLNLIVIDGGEVHLFKFGVLHRDIRQLYFTSTSIIVLLVGIHCMIEEQLDPRFMKDL